MTIKSQFRSSVIKVYPKTKIDLSQKSQKSQVNFLPHLREHLYLRFQIFHSPAKSRQFFLSLPKVDIDG